MKISSNVPCGSELPRILGGFVLVVAILTAATAPVSADDRHDQHQGRGQHQDKDWNHHQDHAHRYWNQPYFQPEPSVVYAPPVVYSAPPAYEEPGISLIFPLHIR